MPPKGSEKAPSRMGNVHTDVGRNTYRAQAKIDGRTEQGPRRNTKAEADADLLQARGSQTQSEFRDILRQLREAAQSEEVPGVPSVASTRSGGSHPLEPRAKRPRKGAFQPTSDLLAGASTEPAAFSVAATISESGGSVDLHPGVAAEANPSGSGAETDTLLDLRAEKWYLNSRDLEIWEFCRTFSRKPKEVAKHRKDDLSKRERSLAEYIRKNHAQLHSETRAMLDKLEDPAGCAARAKADLKSLPPTAPEDLVRRLKLMMTKRGLRA